MITHGGGGDDDDDDDDDDVMMMMMMMMMMMIWVLSHSTSALQMTTGMKHSNIGNDSALAKWVVSPTFIRLYMSKKLFLETNLYIVI